MPLELSRMRHAKPDAIMALRNVALMTTAGSGIASINVAHAGTVIEIYVNAFAAVAVPFGPVTSTEVEPTDPAGVTAVTVVDDTATTFVPGAPPIVTLVAPLRLVPVIVIAVPPSTDPVFGTIRDRHNGPAHESWTPLMNPTKLSRLPRTFRG